VRPLSLDDISSDDIVGGVDARQEQPPDPASFLPLSQAHLHVLVSLTGGEKHGYAVMQDVERLSGGTVRMGPATLYGALRRLAEDHLVEEVPPPAEPVADRRRRYYRITSLGQRTVAAEARRLADLVRAARANLRPGLV
jgi:DNA-binding PadR family transcriptional regulator